MSEEEASNATLLSVLKVKSIAKKKKVPVNNIPEPKTFPCKHCDMIFSSSGAVVRHTRYRHTLEKPYKCGYCDFSCVEKSKLTRHERTHTGERPFQCPYCDYLSTDNFKLKRHMRTHTGEKPYVCTICSSRFTQSSSLKEHQLTHDKQRPSLECPVCKAKVQRQKDLNVHMQRMHMLLEPLVCQSCGESFLDRYKFKIHRLTHKGEKNFKCHLCTFASNASAILETHLKNTHKHLTEIECEQCEYATRSKISLERHVNRVHNPNKRIRRRPGKCNNDEENSEDKKFIKIESSEGVGIFIKQENMSDEEEEDMPEHVDVSFIEVEDASEKELNDGNKSETKDADPLEVFNSF